MAQKITDCGPFLDGLFASFTQSVTAAKDKYLNDIAIADNYYQGKFVGVIPAVSQYLIDHPVISVAYSKAFLSLLAETKAAAISVSGNILSEAQIGYDTMRSNANLDYSEAVSRAYDEFNFALSSAYIVDATFDIKYKSLAGDTVLVTDGNLVSIKSFDGKYLGVGCVSDLVTDVFAKSDVVIDCNRFYRVVLDDGKVTIRAFNGKYLSALSVGVLSASADYVGDHEKFIVTDLGGGISSFSGFGGEFVRVDTSNSKVVMGSGVSGESDKFIFTPIEFKSKMTVFMDTITSVVDAATTTSYDGFSIAYKNSRSQLNDVIKPFILERSVIRFTGVGKKPVSGIVYDDDNVFEFEIENVGKLAWSGSVSLKVKDQYQKSVLSKSVSVGSLAPGSKRSIVVPIYIPKKDPTTGYNFGSTISTLIKFE